MMNSLWSAASGMLAQELNMDVISNNLANTDTTGYKESRVEFQDLLYQTKSIPGSLNASGTMLPVGIQVGNGVRAIGTQKIFTDGGYTSTGSDSDLAIQGAGFFQILMPDGSISYTRNGSFKVMNTGQLVNSDGFPLEPSITIPSDATKMSVGADGTVSVIRGNSTTSEEIGKIELANFMNPSGLVNSGKNLLNKTSVSGDPVIGTPGANGFGSLAQRALETSNVKVVEEMVKMITAQRAYEVNTKSIQTADNMLQMANNLKR